MRLGLTLALGAGIDTALVLEAERLGYSAVWCGESYQPVDKIGRRAQHHKILDRRAPIRRQMLCFP